MNTTDSQDRLAASVTVLSTLSPEDNVQVRLYSPELLDDDVFLAWVSRPELEGLRIESDAHGVISIMSPTGWISGPIGSYVTARLDDWARQDGRGYTSDSSAMYALRGGRRVPDAAWISRERLHSVPPESRKKFLTVAPEFVIEIRPPSDELENLDAKMRLWINDGVLLGLLIDPANKRADIYSAAQPQVKYARETFDGGSILPGFRLDLREIWRLYAEITQA
jgi:Uma2 family endonuclease